MAFSKLTYCVFRNTLNNGAVKLQCKPLPGLLSNESSLLRQFYHKVLSNNSSRLFIHTKCSNEVLKTTIFSRNLRPLLFTGNLNCKVCPSNSLPCQLFHTTPIQKAIPPLVWIVLRPFANVAAVLFGRFFRRFWQRLPSDKRNRIILGLRKRKRTLIGILGTLSLGLLLYVLVHIEEVPYTKRRRFILFSRQDMRNLSEEVQKEILENYKDANVPYNHPLYQRIYKVMYSLMQANKEEIEKSGVSSWNIYVIDDPDVNNAMVLPNGTVFIFTGIIETCSSDDQLGTILAHEIAHVLLNHQGETISEDHISSMLFVLLITAIWAVLPDFAAFLSHLFVSQTKALFIQLPFSRLMESEADAVGLNLAAKACLDVREASVFWAKMALREELGCEEKPLELLSSHPSHESRQKAIDELIPKALKLRESCRCGALSRTDPRSRFVLHKDYLKEAQLKGCLSCKAIFSPYHV